MGDKAHLISALALAAIFSLLVAVAIAAAEQESNVPGCNCNATLIASQFNGQQHRGVHIHTSIRSSLPSYHFDVTDQSTPVCDALDADPTFVSTYGDDSTPYYWFSGGRSTGPY